MNFLHRFLIPLLGCLLFEAKNAAPTNATESQTDFYAKKCQFPHMALLKISTGNKSHICGGSLVDDIHIITAAHCFPKGWTFVDVSLGSTNSSVATATFHINRTNVHLHKDFKTLNSSFLLYENDAAFLVLPRPINASKCIRPITMATHNDTFYSSCFMVGWEINSSKANNTAVLKWENVNVLPDKDCGIIAKQFGKRRICASDLHLHGGKEKCQGGEGGSLVCFTKDNRTVLAGFTSSEAVCQHGISVCNRVAYFFTEN
ncbi:trypsin-2 [Octopus bimaculoides]|uniref:Peptidase S1 domain-containing protein n=1 Tax=Octopus bimaculoides TaxID=37653 RepID=A0A0L8I3P7_OCTBM|nr:trypsin-2 [Octopus bimaculoides]|eukprot:XP_014791103.1 PREDICTED: trypsin-2-like [Octopus bimaculoides]